MPVKRLLQGGALADVVSATVVDNFSVMEDFRDMAEQRLEVVAQRTAED